MHWFKVEDFLILWDARVYISTHPDEELGIKNATAPQSSHRRLRHAWIVGARVRVAQTCLVRDQKILYLLINMFFHTKIFCHCLLTFKECEMFFWNPLDSLDCWWRLRYTKHSDLSSSFNDFQFLYYSTWEGLSYNLLHILGKRPAHIMPNNCTWRKNSNLKC